MQVVVVSHAALPRVLSTLLRLVHATHTRSLTIAFDTACNTIQAPLRVSYERHVLKGVSSAIDATLAVDTWVGTGESEARTAVASSTAWNERLGNTAPFVGVPFGMTHFTVESQRSVHKCIAPFYFGDAAITGFRLSHWLSGSCTQDYGSVTIQPVLVPSAWSADEFEGALQQWLDAFSCNDPRHYAECSTPQKALKCANCRGCKGEGDGGGGGVGSCGCCQFVHSAANVTFPISTPFLQLATIASPGGSIEVAVTASARSTTMHVRVPGAANVDVDAEPAGASPSPTHRLALVFYANVRPRRAKTSNSDSAVPAAITDAKGLLCADERTDGETQRTQYYELYSEDGHSLQDCVSACAAQVNECSRVNFYSGEGVCHLFATCALRKSAAGTDGVMYAVQGNEREATWTVSDGFPDREATFDVSVPVRRIYRGNDEWAHLRGHHAMRLVGARPDVVGTIHGVHSTSWALMPAGAAELTVMAGTSFTGLQGARDNLAADTSLDAAAAPRDGGGGGGGEGEGEGDAVGRDALSKQFDARVKQSKSAWSDMFGRVQLDADDHTRKLAYTALYVEENPLSQVSEFLNCRP
jgi:hypothetical protein